MLNSTSCHGCSGVDPPIRLALLAGGVPVCEQLPAKAGDTVSGPVALLRIFVTEVDSPLVLVIFKIRYLP